MSIPLARLTPAALLLLAFAGCGQPLDDKITARNQVEYGIWASNTLEHLSPDDARVFQEAQQEIKLFIMAHSSATGSEAINQEYLEKVDGLTAHQVMVQGLEDRMQRLQSEHDEAKKLYDFNSSLITRNEASAAILASRIDEDKARADKSAAQLFSTQADLDRIKK
jgi:hypothetical protein